MMSLEERLSVFVNFDLRAGFDLCANVLPPLTFALTTKEYLPL